VHAGSNPAAGVMIISEIHESNSYSNKKKLRRRFKGLERKGKHTMKYSIKRLGLMNDSIFVTTIVGVDYIRLSTDT